MAKFCVLGSMNMDLVAVCDRFPNVGETVIGNRFKTATGGKGGNQAVALGLLEAEVYMVGCLGEDIYGKRYLTHLDNVGVETSGVEMLESESSGIALIEVEPSGANRILVVPGANTHVTPAYIEQQRKIIASCDYLLMQGEIPYESLLYGAKLAGEHGCTTIFDPAPAGEFPAELYGYIDIITPNERETATLTGIDPRNDHLRREAAGILLDRGATAVVLKSGGWGCFYADATHFYQIPAVKKVDVVDTTAAGDGFNAALAFRLGAGQPMEEALKFANVVAAMATERLGAQSAMPGLQEAESRSAANPLILRNIG